MISSRIDVTNLPCSVLGTFNGESSLHTFSSPSEKNSTESSSWSPSPTPPETRIPFSPPNVTTAQA